MPNWKKVIVSGSNAALNSLNVTNGITGSLLGTSSYATQALTASNANTASYVNQLNQSVVVSGSLTVSGSTNFVGSTGTTLLSTNADTLTFTGSIFTSGSIISTGSLNITSVTSSLLGTASYATQALTASYANTATSASYALNATTASYVLNAISASYATQALTASNANTASYVVLAQTASYVLNAVSASYATQALSASYTQTASYVNPLRQTVQITGSFNVSGSTTQIGNNTLTGTSILSGSVSISGSTTVDGTTIFRNSTTTITGSFLVSGSTTQIGNNNLTGNTTLSGSIIISGSTGPGAATASVQIYGDIRQSGYHRFDPVTTNIDTSISASYIYVSGSTNDLYFSQNSAGYANTTRLRWLESNLYTGILNGGIITSTPGSTTWNISSGSGIIVSQNASTGSSPYPTVQYVEWGNLTNIPITNSGSAKLTYVGIDSTGTPVQQVVPWGSTDINQFDTQITLGVVLHLSGSVSTGVFSAPQISYGQPQKMDDFTRAFGPLKISGHVLSPSGSSPTLSIKKTGGNAYKEGANYRFNANHPSTTVENDINVSKIYRYYISGSTPVIDTGVANAGYTVINNDQYVDTTTGNLASVGNSNWSIQRVFWIPNSPTNAFIVYYGNAKYSTLLNAVNAKDSEPFTEAPNTATNAIFLGYIVVEGGSGRDLLNAAETTIIPGGLFRSVGGVGSSGTATVPVSLEGLSDVSAASRTAGDLLYYNGSQWVNSKSLTGNYSITGSFTTNDGISAVSITASVFSGSFVGPLTGTASYATQALTASNANTASYFSGTSLTISQSLTINQNTASLASGAQTISTNSTGSYTSAFYKYTLASGSNARAGQVMAVWNGANIQYTDVATNDIGTTSNVALTASLSGGNVLLTTTLPSSGWTVKTLVNLL
jgi:hypothetical protein